MLNPDAAPYLPDPAVKFIRRPEPPAPRSSKLPPPADALMAPDLPMPSRAFFLPPFLT